MSQRCLLSLALSLCACHYGGHATPHDDTSAPLFLHPPSFVQNQLVSSGEAERLIAIGRAQLLALKASPHASSTPASASTSSSSAPSTRRELVVMLNPNLSPDLEAADRALISAVVRRISNLAGLPFQNAESLFLSRQVPGGQSYGWHGDSLPAAAFDRVLSVPPGSFAFMRLATGLLYLTDHEDDEGATLFENATLAAGAGARVGGVMGEAATAGRAAYLTNVKLTRARSHWPGAMGRLREACTANMEDTKEEVDAKKGETGGGEGHGGHEGERGGEDGNEGDEGRVWKVPAERGKAIVWFNHAVGTAEDFDTDDVPLSSRTRLECEAADTSAAEEKTTPTTTCARLRRRLASLCGEGGDGGGSGHGKWAGWLAWASALFTGNGHGGGDGRGGSGNDTLYVSSALVRGFRHASCPVGGVGGIGGAGEKGGNRRTIEGSSSGSGSGSSSSSSISSRTSTGNSSSSNGKEKERWVAQVWFHQRPWSDVLGNPGLSERMRRKWTQTEVAVHGIDEGGECTTPKTRKSGVRKVGHSVTPGIHSHKEL